MKMFNRNKPEAGNEFAVFFWGRVLIGLAVAAVVILAAMVTINYLGKFRGDHEQQEISAVSHDQPAEAVPAVSESHAGQPVADEPHAAIHQPVHSSGPEAEAPVAISPQAVHAVPTKSTEHGGAVHSDARIGTDTAEGNHPVVPEVKGVAFVDAMMRPMEYELKQRVWGWRPNDLIRFTDNVNNLQLGLLEATRRSATRLAERISRTGTTNVLDENLERAMNCFMINPDSFWLPSAESKYSEGLKELRAYKQRLIAGEADFYTRSDNLIPLIGAFADLLGSCDENLVKGREKTGKPVSTFAADNYFYYAKGATAAILPILEAVAKDFEETLTTRRAMDVLLHAIHSCHEASRLKPLIVLEGDLDGICANHRANMAAHISHARFYLDVLAATLST